MSIDLADLKERLEQARRQRGPIPALLQLSDVIDGIIQYLEEEESYRQEMKERE